MSGDVIEVLRCGDCHVAFLPPRSHCPRCGSRELSRATVPSSGTVLATTELAVPPAGWSTPHRLVMLELEEGVRLLANAPAALPDVGTKVAIELRDGRYELLG